MKVTMLLADAAQAVEGKLYVLGGGWSITGPDPTPSAIAVYIQVPWDRTNVEHAFRFDLVDSDGDSVELETETGVEEPITIEGSFEVGRPAGGEAGHLDRRAARDHRRPAAASAGGPVRMAPLDQRREPRGLAAAVLDPVRPAGATGRATRPPVPPRSPAYVAPGASPDAPAPAGTSSSRRGASSTRGRGGLERPSRRRGSPPTARSRTPAGRRTIRT